MLGLFHLGLPQKSLLKTGAKIGISPAKTSSRLIFLNRSANIAASKELQMR